jgi:hypothetical protein
VYAWCMHGVRIVYECLTFLAKSIVMGIYECVWIQMYSLKYLYSESSSLHEGHPHDSAPFAIGTSPHPPLCAECLWICSAHCVPAAHSKLRQGHQEPRRPETRGNQRSQQYYLAPEQMNSAKEWVTLDTVGSPYGKGINTRRLK